MDPFLLRMLNCNCAIVFCYINVSWNPLTVITHFGCFKVLANNAWVSYPLLQLCLYLFFWNKFLKINSWIKTMHTKAFSLPPSLLRGACLRVSGRGQRTVFRSFSEVVVSLGGKPLSLLSHHAPSFFIFYI